MTITLSTVGETVSVDQRVEGAPAYRITATGVRLINTERGRIISTSADQPAISLEAGGGVIINESGAIIRGFDSFPLPFAIRGSAEADEVRNAGLIVGNVALQGGNDLFVQNPDQSTQFDLQVNLGTGDDAYRLISNPGQSHNINANGGDGFDTLTIQGTPNELNGNYSASLAINFERLELIDANGNLSGFSGFQQISIVSTLMNGFPGTVGLIESRNPETDVALEGSRLRLASGSTLRTVTGSDRTESLEITSSSFGQTRLLGSALLGGGDDEFWWSAFGNAPLPTIGGDVDGGAGIDSLRIDTETEQTIDLGRFSNFERLDTGTYTSSTSFVRLINARDLLEITGDSAGQLTLAQSQLPNAAVTVSSRGTLILESTATIGRYGFPNRDFFETVFDQRQQADDRLSVTVINNGTILGPVQLYYGDDVYDGRMGTTGGTIFGYAGNDRLFGGAGNDRIEGGFGGDDLFGSSGDDTLVGGGGSDRLDGGIGSDTAIFSGGRRDYEVTRSGDTVTVRDLRAQGDGTDTLTGIERAEFADGQVSLIAEELVLFLPGSRDLIAWEPARGSDGFSYFLRVGGNSQVIASADLTGDGRTDMLFRQPDGGLIRWDVAQGGSGFAVLPVSPGFTVVGLGDLRGNAATDILLQGPDRTLRVLDPAAGTTDHLFTLSPGWTVKGVANINGIGKADIILQNDNGTVIAFTEGGWRHLLTLSSGWQIAGLGDVVGGLADDFVLMNSNRDTVFWDVDRGGDGFQTFATLTPGWSIAGLHDLNGDGRDDVLLRNDDGTAIYWTGAEWGVLGTVLAGNQLVGTGVFP